MRLRHAALIGCVSAVYVFLLLPTAIVILTSVNAAEYLSFPPIGFSLRLKSVGTTTLPIQLFDYLRYDFDPTAAAASTVSVALTMSLLVVIDRIYGLRAVRF